jgi:2-keto-3-deoxy-L-rhamnonate aldolase RhmA
MGIPGQLDNPMFLKAVEKVIATCQKYGVLPGIAGGEPTYVRYWHDRGMRMFWCAADIVSMWSATQKAMAGIREGLTVKTAPASPFPEGAITPAGAEARWVRY